MGKKFSSEYQPKARGRSKRTLILEGLRRAAFNDLPENATNEEAETMFFQYCAESAFNKEDAARGVCLKILADKGWSNLKPSMESVEFEFDEKAPPHEQASQVMKAASQGLIAPDIANMFISSIASMLKIEEVTQMRKEIDEIKAYMNELSKS